MSESTFQHISNINSVNSTNCFSNKCIHQLFEEQVTQYPNAVALVFENQQLTYRELNHRANQLAHYLQSLGVKPDDLVGICVERSLETIIGILGILKAGGAYVPLDPAYPQERIAYSLLDSQVTILLTIEKHLAILPSHKAQIVCLDLDWEMVAKSSKENLDSGVRPANLAYVIYTSGSTGKPKGVLIDHCNVVRLFSSTQHWYKFDHHDVWTMFHSYAFDFSVWEIWGALFYGGKLVVVPYLVSRSADTFYQLLVEEGVTVLNQTPSAFIQLIQVEQSSHFHSKRKLNLRYVIFGGEALDLQSLKLWYDRHGDRNPQLVNMYGITETTVHVTYRPISLADLESRSSIIGYPILDLQVYLLDQSLQQVKTGVVGEMYIEGAGLARGYLNRKELTTERFIKNPFSKNSESRLYKSGDLARYLPDGDLEYLGRIDHQVKIRGFRIELGEIETVIAANPDVSQTVAMVREDRPGNKIIVAYLVPRPNAAIEITGVHQQLQEKLPYYMIPAAFVILKSFPLTNNGKIDRRALPKPDAADLVSTAPYVAPQTLVEKQLTSMWAEVLNLKQVGIDDNFFELGGHSLLAVQLVSKMEQIFDTSIPLATLLKAPSIKQLVHLLQSEGLKDAWSPLVPIQTGGLKPPLFCIHGGGCHVLIYRDLAIGLGAEQPVYGLQSPMIDPKNPTALNTEKCATYYLQEIRLIQPQGPYYLAGLSAGGTIAFEIAQQLIAQNERVASLVMFDTYVPGSQKLLPTVSRFVSSLRYAMTISGPRFLARYWQKQFGKQKVGAVNTTAITESTNSLLTLKKSRQGKNLDPEYPVKEISAKNNPLEHWMDRFSEYVLEHSSWVFYQRLIYKGLIGGEQLEQLHEAYTNVTKVYIPQAYSGKVALFKAAECPPGFKVDRKLGWGEIVTGDLEVHAIPGDHVSIMRSPLLAKKLQDYLNKVQSSQS